jgi:hypothetical protein
LVYQPAQIDGLPGFITLGRDHVPQTTALALADDKIVAIFTMRNPDKLTRLRLPSSARSSDIVGCHASAHLQKLTCRHLSSPGNVAELDCESPRAT